MDVQQVQALIENFRTVNRHLIGEFDFFMEEPIDAARFPYELNGKFKKGKSGLYIFSSKDNHKILYIGIANDIPGRFWVHIGSNFSWTNPDSIASFPNFNLNWEGLHQETKECFCNANFSVTAFILNPPEISRLIESFLIFWAEKHGGRPERNISF